MEDKNIHKIKDAELGSVAGGKGGGLIRYPMDEKCRECSSDNINISHKGGSRFKIVCNDCGASYTITTE